MTLIVPGCRLLIKPLKEEEVDPKIKAAKALGIQFLDEDTRKSQINIDRGVVLKIGPEADKVYISGLEVGDTIGFTKFGGKFIEDPETKEMLLVINDEDLVVIFKENK
jgi:co-chaperonin GroES (HSP10)